MNDDHSNFDALAASHEQRGAKVRDAAHISLQSLGRAVDATDSILQSALFDLHVHGDSGEYSHLNEKGLDHGHTAMKYVTMGTTIGDSAIRSDGAFFSNLFKDPNALPDLVMPMLTQHRHL
ncbi:hypothetical protein KFE25_006718 [Diacronema lutheri]|uniref:Uncharacterized protein n=1 Tax=Diacronema lutheri TaxID=2081491 RepID=A0A8J5XF41_DIALT|nr:hypothetical protein KFE25_006718 [Diacronema lutheri]